MILTGQNRVDMVTGGQEVHSHDGLVSSFLVPKKHE